MEMDYGKYAQGPYRQRRRTDGDDAQAQPEGVQEPGVQEALRGAQDY